MKRELNTYLYYEFGLDDGEGGDACIQEDWPFVLEPAGAVNEGPVFRFRDADTDYYLVTKPALNFFPAADMTIDDVRIQRFGADWIADRHPVDLNTTATNDSITPIIQRRSHIEQLATASLGEPPTRILESLFLQRTRQHLAIVSCNHGDWVIGDDLVPIQVPFDGASAWRRLAWGIGRRHQSL